MAALLMVATIALYWPATGHDFVSYDDWDYVLKNRHVQAGLTWGGLAWAFGQIHGESTYWHPVTWVSHMVDCQLFGLKPMGHHLMNLLLHALNAALVFQVFRRMTGQFWRCAILAGLFALHPLQVDTVAWVAERKNLLSTLFWLLTIWAYVRYVESRSQRSEIKDQRSGGSALVCCAGPASFYLVSLLLFALGLMCKPVLVTLPFVLLLLDYWPLQRGAEWTTAAGKPGQTRVWGRLVAEKVPFLALAGLSSLVTIVGHKQMGVLAASQWLPLGARLENALVAYVRYLGKTIWPSHLAVFYPYRGGWHVWSVAACGLLLVAISGLVILTARSRPFLFVGWFWFIGVLVPFIGLIQAGAQAMADRFAYVPLLGLLLACVWGAHELACGWGVGRVGLAAMTAAAALACAGLTRQQLGYWKDSEALFRHALQATGDNYIARISLGAALDAKGQTDAAISEYRQGLRLKPAYPLAHNNLGLALVRKGQTNEAIGEYQEAIRLKPDYAEAHYNLGNELAKQGQTDEAVKEYRAVLRLKPDDADAHYNLAKAFARRDQITDAITEYRAAIRLNGEDADIRYNFGNALARKGQTSEAIHQYTEALRLLPNYAEAHYNLGNELAQKGELTKARSHYQEALRLKPDYADAHYNLGNLLAGQAQIEEAIRQFQDTIRLKPDYADAHYNLATVLAAKGQTAEAITEFEAVLRLKPDDAEARKGLVHALETKKASAGP